jgi:hypothetical protein
MTRHITTYILILLATSCTNSKSTKNKQEYQAEYHKHAKEFYKIKNANYDFFDSFLENITDTILREKWDLQLRSNFIEKSEATTGIDQISYILMLQADSIKSWQVDTVNPANLINFNERNNTSELLKHGLNKVLLQYLREYDRRLSDTLYGNPMHLSKTKNLCENELFWNSISNEIETLGEFQICKVKLYRQMELSLSKRLEYYETLYLLNK